jgi:hypothetical protein
MFLTYPMENIEQGRVDFRASAKLALRPAAARDRPSPDFRSQPLHNLVKNKFVHLILRRR